MKENEIASNFIGIHDREGGGLVRLAFRSRLDPQAIQIGSPSNPARLAIQGDLAGLHTELGRPDWATRQARQLESSGQPKHPISPAEPNWQTCHTNMDRLPTRTGRPDDLVWIACQPTLSGQPTEYGWRPDPPHLVCQPELDHQLGHSVTRSDPIWIASQVEPAASQVVLAGDPIQVGSRSHLDRPVLPSGPPDRWTFRLPLRNKSSMP